MKISPAQADRFVASPDAGLRAVLVYGPDGGLVRERADQLARGVVDDLSDPFRVAELTGAVLADDPARLADEMAALALTGGRSVAEPLADLLGGGAGEALLVIESGELPPRSALRKLCEESELAAALPCYKDDARSLAAVIRETLGAAGLEAAPEAIAFLAGRLGDDRQTTRRELEKLVLYMGANDGAAGARRVTIEDAAACVGDNAEMALDDLAFAVAEGDARGLERVLARSQQQGLSPIATLRAAAGHFQRLHFVAGLSRQGVPPAEAIKRLRPPVFWKLAERFKAQSAAWPLSRLARVLERLLEAEMACKRSGAPQDALAARALLEIAANAPRKAAVGQR
jgi:DNA polymerase-3 subunit delta